MPPKTTTFLSQALAESWSDPTGWTNGEPVNGDNVMLTEIGAFTNVSHDDLSSLSVATLTVDLCYLDVDSRSLTIGTVKGFDPQLVAYAQDANAPATVTIGDIAIVLGAFSADGAGATLVDQSAVDQGEDFSALHGGTVELFATPAAVSSFDYAAGTTGTFAFKNPPATNSAPLTDLSPGAVLELPGTSVSTVAIAADSLSVTTNLGTYSFTKVAYATAVRGYTAAFDPNTGLMAITFNSVNTFQQTKKAASGDYLWSNAANWTDGVPANASGFTVDAAGDDDLASLRLVDLTLDKTGAEPEIQVTGATLTVADLLENSSGGTGLLEADAKAAGAPVTVTLGQNDAHGVTFEANGAGATLLADATAGSDAGTYVADNGGVVEILNAPLFTDILSYGTNGVFAFKTPAASNINLIEGVAAGDAIELPGTAVSNVTFGDSSLTVTTNIGTYSFGDVVYTDEIDNYSAAFDPTSGLVAITFRGANTFTPTVQTNAGQEGPQQFLWSNGANWTEGVPVNGDSILTTYKSLSTEYQLPIDDIQN